MLNSCRFNNSVLLIICHLTKMPCLKILTNIPKSNIPNDFVTKIIPVLVEGVRKLAHQFVCVIESDCQLIMDGNTSLPAVVASLESIGNLGSENNRRISKLLTQFIEKELGVNPNRIFITYYDLQSYNVAKGGLTVEDILKQQ